MIAHIALFVQLPANISDWIKGSFLMGSIISPQGIKVKTEDKSRNGMGRFSGGGKGGRGKRGKGGRERREGRGRRGRGKRAGRRMGQTGL